MNKESLTHAQHANLGRIDSGCDRPAGDGRDPAVQSKIVQATEALQTQGDRLNRSTCTLRVRLDTTLGAQLEEQATPIPPPLPGSSAAKKPGLPDIENLFVAIENVEREYRYLVVQLERLIPLTGE